MKVKYKGFDIEGSAAEVMELINMAAGETKTKPVVMDECDGEICVGDCDKCDIHQKSKVKPVKEKAEVLMLRRNAVSSVGSVANGSY